MIYKIADILLIKLIIIFAISLSSAYSYQINIPKYSMTQTNSIVVTGKLDNDYLKISNAFVMVDSDNTFKVELPLQNGLNLIPIILRSNENKLMKHNYYVQRNAKFADIANDHWSKNIIEQLVSYDIIPSYSDLYFEPTSKITHGELLYWIVKLKGYKLPTKYSRISPYLEKDSWLTPYMIAAKKNGLIRGNLKRFNPHKTISRKDAILLILNNFKMIKGETVHQTESLKNFLQSSKLNEEIKTAIKSGILFGPSTEWLSVDLNRPIYKDEIAKVIYYTETAQDLMDKRKKGKSLSIKTVSINTAPQIDAIKLYPKIIYFKNVKSPTQMVFARVTVIDPDGLEDIASVELDITKISKKRTVVNMLDNGAWGDNKAGDGEYSLELSIRKDVNPGTMRFPINVTDKSGFQTRSYLPLEIVKGE